MAEKKLDFDTILVLGNGFDLGHGLPTRYTDFISFSKNIIENTSNNETIKNLIKNNPWFNFFKNVKDGNNKWSDFEALIENIVEQLEKTELLLSKERDACFRYEDIKTLDTFFLAYSLYNYLLKKNYYNRKKLFIHNELIKKRKTDRDSIELPIHLSIEFQDSFIENVGGGKPYILINFENLISSLLDELDDFTKAFELYLVKSINFKDKKKIAFIDEIFEKTKGIKVINFNYTDTISIYQEYLRRDCEVETCFIHGKAFINQETNNLVLGIDEKNPNNINIKFLRFKKFFQRTEKNTSRTYLKWIKYIKNFPQRRNLFIIGHSLAVSDKKILKDLITIPNLFTTIFYYAENDRLNLMLNLAYILGAEEFETLTGNDRIIFKKEKFNQKAHLIKN